MGIIVLGYLPLLSLQSQLPIVGALLVGSFAAVKMDRLSIGFGRVFSFISLLLCVPLLQHFDLNQAGMQAVEQHNWIPAINAHYALGIDGISLVLVVLTVLISAIVIFSSENFVRQDRLQLSR